MKYIVTNILNRRKIIYQLSLMFGEDRNQNAKAKRMKYRK